MAERIKEEQKIVDELLKKGVPHIAIYNLMNNLCIKCSCPIPAFNTGDVVDFEDGIQGELCIDCSEDD